MNNIHNLTIIIVTYKTDEKILEDCLNSIDSSVNILIVENSNNISLKEKLEKNYINLKVVLTGTNLGYGGGNNFGLKNVKTNYALILNPDVILEANFFKEINFYLNEEKDFSIIGTNYKDDDKWKTSGLFKDFHKKKDLKKKDNNSNQLEEVDWVIGCSMLINIKKFENKEIFDENIFLYFDEFDLCRRVKLKQGKIFSAKNLVIKHLGKKGSADSKYVIEFEKLRNWHWMWSTFYYHKKHFGYLYAVYKIYGKFFRSLFNIILFTIMFNKKQRSIYLSRASGIINAMIGSKSFYRVSLPTNDQEN